MLWLELPQPFSPAPLPQKQGLHSFLVCICKSLNDLHSISFCILTCYNLPWKYLCKSTLMNMSSKRTTGTTKLQTDIWPNPLSPVQGRICVQHCFLPYILFPVEKAWGCITDDRQDTNSFHLSYSTQLSHGQRKKKTRKWLNKTLLIQNMHISSLQSRAFRVHGLEMIRVKCQYFVHQMTLAYFEMKFEWIRASWANFRNSKAKSAIQIPQKNLSESLKSSPNC